jgi:hypothetical protein
MDELQARDQEDACATSLPGKETGAVAAAPTTTRPCQAHRANAMDRYARERAARRVAEYFSSRTPLEAVLRQDGAAFGRAKRSALEVMRRAVEEVGQLELVDFRTEVGRGIVMSKPFWPDADDRDVSKIPPADIAAAIRALPTYPSHEHLLAMVHELGVLAVRMEASGHYDGFDALVEALDLAYDAADGTTARALRESQQDIYDRRDTEAWP